MVWLPDGEKFDMFSRFEFDTIPACDRQTDGHLATALSALMQSMAQIKMSATQNNN